MKKIFFVLLMTLNSYIINAQLAIDNSTQTPQQLAQNVLLGQGINISNIKFNNSAISANTINDQIGEFSNGTTTNIGINKGIILSTGNSLIAQGPNDRPLATLPTSNSYIGDNDLYILSNNQVIKNVAILEFDFVPTGNKLNFNFVFASEEYPEFVNDTYNDNFGFFLSGPGLTGPFSGNAKNIALIPNTSLPVSINNLNNGVSNSGPCEYCQYFINNESGTSIQYDGFTKVIGATADVQCGQTYHIKLAIANVGDDNYDSAVFIEGASFSSPGINLGGDLNLCSVNQYQLDTGLDASVIHQWTLDGQIIPNESKPSIIINKSGTYGVKATPLGTGCPASDEIKVGFNIVKTPEVSCGTKTSNSIQFNWLPILNIAEFSISYKIGINPEIQIGAVGNVNSYTVTNIALGETVVLKVTPIGGTPADCFGPNSISCTLDNCLVSPTIILNQGTTLQQICKDTAITDIIFTIGGGATNASITSGSLPAGVTTSLVGDQFTISGTATASGNFSYTISTSGGCGANASISGSITVLNSPTINLNQGATSQQICKDSAISDIIFTIGGGATNASITSGSLPAGVTTNLVGDQFTIKGIGTNIGLFNYTISTSGGCGANANISGSITVLNSPTINLNQGATSQQICKDKEITDIIFTIGGGSTNASITSGSLPAGVTTNLVGDQFTISGTATASGQFNYTISTSGGCGANASISGSITVLNSPTINLNQGAISQQICENSAITDIIYIIGGGATNASITKGSLPAGITTSVVGDQFTISGTATAAGNFSYTISTSGGCGANASASGSITVNPMPIPSLADGMICIDKKTSAVIQSYVLDSKLNSVDYDFEWFLNGKTIINAVGNTLETIEKGIYSVIATDKTTNCPSDPIEATITENFSDSTVVKIEQTNSFIDAATITISIIQGIGNYEYQLDNGIFQTSPVFSEVPAGTHIINILEVNGCYNLSEKIVVLGYPKFFTPNGDNYNDTWNVIGFNTKSNPVIYIFDRYGKLLKQISPFGNGWDGTYNGHPLPSTDYWFVVKYYDNGIQKEFKSHFSLKR